MWIRDWDELHRSLIYAPNLFRYLIKKYFKPFYLSSYQTSASIEKGQGTFIWLNKLVIRIIRILIINNPLEVEISPGFAVLLYRPTESAGCCRLKYITVCGATSAFMVIAVAVFSFALSMSTALKHKTFCT